MTQPRSTIVSLDDTSWYHCVNRCVRRAFLCSEDHFSGKNFEHRRDWIATRIKQLSEIFAIDVAAYAVMSNHYHVVVRIDLERASGWSMDTVLHRWTTLFSGPPLVARYLTGARAEMLEAEIARVEELAETYRERLHDLSWFMRTLNEYIARLANAEDGVKGRFWEGRFKSQALLDEKALLAAMAYVDLNPVRAGLAETPEASDYTSIQERVAGVPACTEHGDHLDSAPAKKESASESLDGESLRPDPQVASLPQAPLMPFDGTGQTPWAIPFAFEDYLELVDWTGRAIRSDECGYIVGHQPKILDRLGIDGACFITYADRMLEAFGTAVGAPQALIRLCARRQTKYLRGMRAARALFVTREAA